MKETQILIIVTLLHSENFLNYLKLTTENNISNYRNINIDGHMSTNSFLGEIHFNTE